MNGFRQHEEPPLLEVRNLSLSFHNQKQVAIDRVSFSIRSGNTLGLIGASGAGKSSMTRVILNLLEADSGEVLFKGKNISQMDSQQLMATRQSMQLIFQEPSASLSPRRTIEQTLMEPLKHFAIGDTNYRHEKVRKTLQIVGLNQSVLEQYPHQFSSGEQQRIAIARALVTDPELVIADEAVSSLDVSIQAQILQLIQNLQSEHGITFLFISHDLAVIRQIADEVAVMYRGELLERSTANTFFSNPAHPYSKLLLSFTNDETPLRSASENWCLERGRLMSDNNHSCVFAALCPDKMPVCERLDPISHAIVHRNQHILERHCVKCHIYDETQTNET